MKTPEEMMAYFRAMPTKRADPNLYWSFNEEACRIEMLQKSIEHNSKANGEDITSNIPFDLRSSSFLLYEVREFFRRYYESFYSEAQVLCVTKEDAVKLKQMGTPVLTYGSLGLFDVEVMVLPQDNSGGTSRISEAFWQNRIIGGGIKPVARIHSHHVLDPYQSSIDYASLNSGTLEMVLGKITNEELNVCYWLDVPGTDVKAQTFLAKEMPNGQFEVVPHKFHSTSNDLSAGSGFDE